MILILFLLGFISFLFLNNYLDKKIQNVTTCSQYRRIHNFCSKNKICCLKRTTRGTRLNSASFSCNKENLKREDARSLKVSQNSNSPLIALR